MGVEESDPESDSTDSDDTGLVSAQTSNVSWNSRRRSSFGNFTEDDLWNPDHVAAVTRKLFKKHDKDNSGLIDWTTGEAMTFLHEFFWLHKQPPPRIAKAAYSALYSQV